MEEGERRKKEGMGEEGGKVGGREVTLFSLLLLTRTLSHHGLHPYDIMST